MANSTRKPAAKKPAAKRRIDRSEMDYHATVCDRVREGLTAEQELLQLEQRISELQPIVQQARTLSASWGSHLQAKYGFPDDHAVLDDGRIVSAVEARAEVAQASLGPAAPPAPAPEDDPDFAQPGADQG